MERNLSLEDDRILKKMNEIVRDYSNQCNKKNEYILNLEQRLKKLEKDNHQIMIATSRTASKVEQKIKNHLSYKVGYEIVHNSNSFKSIIKLPFSLYKIWKNHNKKIEINNKNITKSNKFAISVIVAAYNCENYIAECIDSIIGQTFKNFELIIVDDGSTDKTLKILREYEKKYNFISVYTQKNQYAGVARNTGMLHAKGEYYLFLDSDDFFDPELLAKTYNKATSTNADIVIFKGQEYDTQNKTFQSCKFPVSPELFPNKEVASPSDFGEKLFQANSCLAWNKLFRAEFVSKVGIKFGKTKSSNDTVFVYSLLTKAERIAFLDEVLVNYRVNNPHSLQRSKSSSWECICLAFFELKKKLIDLGTYDLHKRTFINKSLQACMYYLSTIDNHTKVKMEAALQNKYFKLLDLENIKPNYIYNKNFYNQYNEIQSKRYIPVVYASDNNYASYTCVSMESIMCNISNKEKVLFFILVDGAFSEENKNKILSRTRKHNCFVEFVNMENKFSDVKSKIPHISYCTVYRLVIPSLFPFFNRIVYLDGDTIIRGNIYNLYNHKLNDNYIAGVIANAFTNKKHQARLGIDTSHYVNAGVLVMNNRLLIRDKMMDKFLDLLKKEYDCLDQDIINVACVGKIMNIHFSYNLMTKYWHSFDKLIEQGVFTRNEVDATIKNPKIIHYADKIKPWDDKSSPLANFFWEYAVKTPYYN